MSVIEARSEAWHAERRKGRAREGGVRGQQEEGEGMSQAQRPADSKVDITALLAMRERGATQAECARHFGVHLRVISRIIRRIGAQRTLNVRAMGMCQGCGREFEKSRLSRKFCSNDCAHKSRLHPMADQDLIRRMYEAGSAQREIAEALRISLKAVQSALRHAGVQPRRAIKRDQWGDRNSNWRGDAVGYKGAHYRVRRVRGAPRQCEHCGAQPPQAKMEWASISRRYHDPFDYKSLCIPCHRAWDAERDRHAY